MCRPWVTFKSSTRYVIDLVPVKSVGSTGLSYMLWLLQSSDVCQTGQSELPQCFLDGYMLQHRGAAVESGLNWFSTIVFYMYTFHDGLCLYDLQIANRHNSDFFLTVDFVTLGRHREIVLHTTVWNCICINFTVKIYILFFSSAVWNFSKRRISNCNSCGELCTIETPF